MSLPAVLQFVESTLNGTESAYLPAAKAFVTPQAGDLLDVPIIAVWTRTYKEQRATMTRVAGNPGSSGFKKATHTVELYVKATGLQTDTHADIAFPTLLEAIQAALRAVVMPFTVTDPATGAESQVTQIGEQFTTTIGTIAATRDQRQYIWRAQITTPVEEWLQS